MKKIIIILFLCTAFSAQAQTYEWELQPGLFTSWTVYNDLIRVSVRSDNQDAFCFQDFYIVQLEWGGMALSGGKAKPSDTYGTLLCIAPDIKLRYAVSRYGW